MEHYLPEIFWHDRKALLSVDFQKIEQKDRYKIVTTSVQKEVRIWEFEFEVVNGKNERASLAVNFVANLVGHSGAVNVARFSPDGKLLASGDCEGSIFVWKVGPITAQNDLIVSGSDDMPPNKENWIRARQPFRHDSDVCALCWNLDGTLIASVSNDDSVLVHNVLTGKRVWSIRNHHHFPEGIVWDPRGKYLITLSTDRKLDIIDAVKGSKLKCISSAELPDTFIHDVQMKKGVYKLFHDDQLMSFSRGCDFSPDGELLFAPCAHLEVHESNVYGTYVFRRKDFPKSQPFAFLPSSQPTHRVACCPLMFSLCPNVKENALGVPYRILWAIMTKDSVTVYDSQSFYPFAYVDNIHYNNLSDIAWSPDGSILLISSLEGYCSFLRFDLSSVGEVMESVPSPPPSPVLVQPKKKGRPPKCETENPAASPKAAEKGLLASDPVQSAEVTPSRPLVGTKITTPKTRSIINYFKKSSASISKAHIAEKEDNHNNIDLDITIISEPCPEVAPVQSSSTSTPTAASTKVKKRASLISVPPITLD
ncbi:hypothetical protein AB6A40_008148 [Gnathostoma spinigerum]|uniref:CAF1B/HIR1 beta-propeller domain-containing protein n=1 Tax=Gnathostoma spinigerum TaxID=75299 RepID=A0ABD6EVZ9_9BILA